MPRPPYFTPNTILACGWLLATAASAAELGDIAVRSFIGQPLSADIELVQLAPDEIGALQVRLAQENVFRGANISMNPALTSLHLAIVRREQRQFLRLSTTRPIEAEYVHLFLELGPAGRQEVRAATVWLQADPNPAQRAAPMAVSATAPAPAPLPAAPAALAEAAVNRDALPVVRPRAAPMPSLHESEIGTPGGLRASAAPPVRRPVAPAKALPAKVGNEHDGGRAEASLPLPVAQALLPLPGLPLPKSVKHAPAPAACTPAVAGGAKECAALAAHSVELKSKLVELEGKVKVLQGALGAPPAAANAAPAAASASAAASAHGETPDASHSTAPPGVKGELAKAREAANAAHGEAGSASASASASDSASAAAEAASDSSAAASAAASVPVKKVKVLPKLKYKKEKPPEPAPSSNLPLIAAGGAAAVLLLGLAGWLFWRKKRGAAPLKIWQGFRKKKAAEPEVKHQEAPPLEEVTPESMMQ